ncbi:hypothetical protein H4R33_000322 [Dimargaris cristalligena]|uniref:Uncharacterized protein n=1 Tax=Dimargaris cristalligena TaxID=215637 RepID=A0A4P9ZSK9_9FUNG|nr:hypothetical protein H4R33_000322 [Dimargaris cristalligena]RKP35692.1 hypothetical protein BJ085DRAFT_40390 [Dimargaris cristalligena]|eukprot:RKP35692.1 hypothetical protein BJ085DRAFT_40390 [Dimargaris cristalligena]
MASPSTSAAQTAFRPLGSKFDPAQPRPASSYLTPTLLADSFRMKNHFAPPKASTPLFGSGSLSATVGPTMAMEPPTFFQVFRAQIAVNHRRLLSVLRPGERLPRGQPWSTTRLLMELGWEYMFYPYFQGLGLALLRHWYAYARHLRPWPWMRERLLLRKA